MTDVILSEEELFCLDGCGSYEEYRHMRQQFEKRECPFCNVDPNINKILHENLYWMIWENAYKRNRHCKTMLVIVLKPHINSFTHMNFKQWVYFEDMVNWASENFDLSGGLLLMRFGDMRFNAGTVPHLHFNLWVPDGTGEVNIPVFKDPKGHSANQERASLFAQKYNIELG